MNKKLQKEADNTLVKLESLTKHIRNVQENCWILGEKLVKQGEIELGRRLIANGFCHDNSKFSGIEWNNLSLNPKQDEAKLKMKLAIDEHRSCNPHHPEYWPEGIHEMSDLYLAEMAADICARGRESGTNVREWLDTIGLHSYKFDKDSKPYKKLTYFLDILLDKPLEKI